MCQISWTVALAGRFSQSDLLLSTVIPIVLVITSEVTTTGWGLWSEVDTPLTEYTLPDDTRPRRIVITPDDVIYYTDYARGILGSLDPAL